MKKLEVYFSKLPKSCLECPCFQYDEMCCGLDDETHGYFKDEIDGGKCPLKKIQSHDALCKKLDSLSKENSHLKAQIHKEKQEIVNEVCESIRELGLKHNLEDLNGVFISYKALQEIQKEYEK